MSRLLAALTLYVVAIAAAGAQGGANAAPFVLVATAALVFGAVCSWISLRPTPRQLQALREAALWRMLSAKGEGT